MHALSIIIVSAFCVEYVNYERIICAQDEVAYLGQNVPLLLLSPSLRLALIQ